MKSHKVILSLLLLITCSFAGFSQVNLGSHSVDVWNKEGVLFSPETMMNVLQEKQRSSQYDNNIFIKQVGVENTINTHVASTDAKVVLNQNGNRNDIQMKVHASEARYEVVQAGDSNSLIDYTFSPMESASLTLSQNGNENAVIKYGTNSIANRMEIKMEGDSKSLIIRNYQ